MNKEVFFVCTTVMVVCVFVNEWVSFRRERRMCDMDEPFREIVFQLYEEIWDFNIYEDGTLRSDTSKKNVCKAVYRLQKLLYQKGIAMAIEMIRERRNKEAEKLIEEGWEE